MKIRTMKSFVMQMFIWLLLILVASYFTRDVITITLPAIVLFGFVWMFFLTVMEMCARLYACPVCETLGAINLTRWQKLVNSFSPGKLGDKCPRCNGSGWVDVRKFYLDNIEKIDGDKIK